MRETLALGGKACRPLIARDGLSHAFIEPAMKHLQATRRRAAAGARIARHDVRWRPGVAARLRRRQTRARGRRCGHRRGADACRGGAAARAGHAAGLPLHRQRPFQDRCAAPRAADAGADQRHDRMDFCVRGPAVGDDQRRRPADGHPARGAGADDLEEVAKATGIAADLPPWQIVRERRATFAATPDENSKRPGARDRNGRTCFWPETGPRPDCPRRSKARSRSGNRAAELGERTR